MKRLILALAFLLAASGVRAADVYVSQSGGGSGASCASPRALSSLVTGDWGPDNTVHGCGTLSSAAGAPVITVLASGTSGHPTIFIMEPGAIIQSPAFPGNPDTGSCTSNCGGVQAINKQFFILDGGTNGIIRNTLAGSSLKVCFNGTCSQGNSTVGVFGSGSNFIIRNFNISSIYISCGATNCSDPNSGASLNAGIRVDSGSSNVNICNNHVTQAYKAISTDSTGGAALSSLPSCASNGTPTGFNIFSNVLVDNCHHVEPTGAGTPSVFANDISSWADWIYPGSGSLCHTDGVITYGNSGQQIHTQIFNNYIHGDLGLGSPTGFIFCTYGVTTSGSACTIYNNLLVATGATLTCCQGIYFHAANGNPLGPHLIYSNLIYGGFTTGGVYMDGDSSTLVTMRDNIFVSNGGYYFQINLTPLANFTSNNNLFYLGRNPGGGNGGFPAGRGLAAWQATVPSHDTNSVEANPLLNVNYMPQAGSPALNLGANLSAAGIALLNFDKNGVSRPGGATPWDAGPFQTPSGPTAPSVPAGLTPSVAGSTVSLTWSASTGTTPITYNVKRGTVSGGPYTTITSGGVATTSYQDTNLVAGTYYYVVSATNAAGSSANSSQVSATVQPQVVVPAAPTSPSATVSGTNIILTWTASLGTPSNYVVGRSTVSGGPYTTIATLGLVTTYQDSNLANGTYYYVIAATNSAGSSPNSSQVSGTVATAPAANLTPSTLNFGSVLLGSNAVQTVNLTNLGNATLSSIVVNSPSLPDYGEADSCSTLAAGASCIITVTFTPSALGSRPATMVVTSNASPVTETLSGLGAQAVTAAPSSINFGNGYVNQTSSVIPTVTVTNYSGSTITFTSVSASSQFGVGGGNTCVGALTNLSQCTIPVTFTPTSNGNKSGTLTISYTGSTGSPITVSLSGKASGHQVRKGVMQ